LHSNFDEHETLVTLEQSETHTIEQQYFSLGILAWICKWKGNSFSIARIYFPLDMRLSLTYNIFLGASMQFYFDLSYLLSLHEVVIMWIREKMIHHLYMVSLFIYGSIRVVVIPSSKTFSFPPTSMSFFLLLVACLFIRMIIIFLTYLYFITRLKIGGDTLIKCWETGCTGCMISPNIFGTWYPWSMGP